VGRYISDGAVLELIDRFLRQDVMQEGKRWTPTGGTPQGAVITPWTQKVTSSLNEKLF
jgi:RNA-directed DNA polymerase